MKKLFFSLSALLLLAVSITGSALPSPATPADAWFTATNYIGAVDPTGTAWYSGWSFFD